MAHLSSETFRKSALALALVAGGVPAFAVTADDVVCSQCVDTSDIKSGAVNEYKLAPNSVSTYKLQKNAVTTEKIAPNSITEWKLKSDSVTTIKIKDGAVSSDKIQDGAISYSKLDGSVQAAIDSTTAYDFRDYGNPNVTQKVFAMLGDFGNCPGLTVPPDTEVEDYVRTDLGGGLTQVVATSWRYVGGVGGTPCRKDVNRYIQDGNTYRLISSQRYQADGTTLVSDVDMGYDPVTGPDRGLVLFTTNMQMGIDYASTGITTESVSATIGGFISEMVLVDAGFAATIDEGGANEETFGNCIKTLEDRTSKHLGRRARARTLCTGVGNILQEQVDTDGSSYIWELVDYTAVTP